ncbi:MAG: hypothetical protein ACREGR_03255 [Minisyncoccia bacterium]
MSQSALSLRRIEGQAAARIASAIATPNPPKGHQPVIKVVAGIDVIDREAHESAIATFVGELKAYQQDADKLRTMLSDAGVSHLAVLPSTAWNGMCEEAGLYRFSPDAAGRVVASNSVLNSIEMQATRKLGTRPLVALAGGAVLCAGAAFYLTQNMAWEWTATSVVFAAVVGGFVSGRFVEACFFTKKLPDPESLAIAEAGLLRKSFGTQALALATLWPKRAEPTAGFRLKIRVPPAPADAQENLAKAHKAGLELSLAVVGEAISFDEDPIGLLLKQRGDRYEQIAADIAKRRAADQAERERKRRERAAAWEAFMSDPIVTTSLGRATAVIVQYGDFPIEQSVVDRVLEERLV